MCLERASAQRQSESESAYRDRAQTRMGPTRSPWSRLLASLALLALLAGCLTTSGSHCHMKRSQYHEQGLYGPKSYRFGYTTGDHKNPMERHETSDAHGHVKGWYSFVDAHGKHQVVHYEAHPKLGFRVHPNRSGGRASQAKRHYAS